MTEKENSEAKNSEANKLTKPQNPDNMPKGILVNPASGTVKISGRSRLHSALAKAPHEDPAESFRKAAQAASRASNEADSLNDPLTALNRIAIMADVSTSMNEAGDGRHSMQRYSLPKKIDHLKTALTGFLNQVLFENTSVAIYTFPLRGQNYNEDLEMLQNGIGISYRLSFNSSMLHLAVQGLIAAGGTPMAQTMDKVLSEIPLTRGIIVSDGDADSYEGALAIAKNYRDSETVIDTVHIGTSTSGERLLQEIAEITHGVYLKFDNVANFSKAFAYLTPEKRGTLMLTGAAALLGAKEIKTK